MLREPAPVPPDAGLLWISRWETFCFNCRRVSRFYMTLHCLIHEPGLCWPDYFLLTAPPTSKVGLAPHAPGSPAVVASP